MRTFSRVITVFFCLPVFFSGCGVAYLRTRPPLENLGAAYLYLQPVSPEADRLSFTLESVSAVGEKGEEIPLSLNVRDISVRAVSRQRLLASGELPPGRYNGFLFKARKASLAGEEDNAALQVSEEPGRIEFPFVVNRRQANVLSLTFQYAQSLKAGVVFNPRFAVAQPGKPVIGVMGFVVNRGSNTVTVFNKISGQITGVIPTGAVPGGMVVDPFVRSRAFVAVSGEDAVEVIDLLGGETIERIRLFGGDRPLEVAMTPDGKTLFTVNSGSNTVSLIDPVFLNEIARIGVGIGPRSILLDTVGHRAYVFNTQGNSISVIDIPTRQVVSTIATETGPLRGQFSRRGDRLYIIHQWSPYLLVLDPVSLAVVRKQYIGMGYLAMKVDANTDRIYLARKGATDVEVYDPFSLVANNFLKVGGEVMYMTIDDQENNLLLVIPEGKTLRLVDLIRGGTRAEFDVEDDPCWVTVMGER